MINLVVGQLKPPGTWLSGRLEVLHIMASTIPSRCSDAWVKKPMLQPGM